MNFASNIENSCKLNPDKTCVVQGELRLTFSQMEERADRLARALVETGIKPGDRVAIFQTNCFQFCEMLYAVGKAGGIFVNLNFRFRGEEVSYILNDCTPNVLILGDRYSELIQSIRSNLPSIGHYIVIGEHPADWIGYESLLSRQSAAPFSCHAAQEDDTACLIYTSGTTGYPKGAMITQANILTPLTDRYTIGEGTLLLNVPMYHIAGVVSTLLPLYRGDTQIVLPQFETGIFLDTVEREKVSATYLVPTMLQGILDHPDFPKKDLSSLRHIGYGASPMPVSLLMRAKKLLNADFTNYFGLTESTGIVSVLSPEDHLLEGSPEEIAKKTRRLAGIGRSIPEGQVRIVDDQDRDVPTGHVGEIVARGKKVMKGYWNKAKATEEALWGGWLHTGDLASMDEDGYLTLAGRKKDMIIRGGENIYPVEIENVLHSHPKVLEAAVIGVPDQYWGEIVKAVIVLRPGQQATAEEIIGYCHEKLASYKKPAIVEFVAALPKNAMQKVLKNVLRGAASR
jgi:acyl-CoA synthetase (AMP-forming)/AMP-acid ligase II